MVCAVVLVTDVMRYIFYKICYRFDATCYSVRSGAGDFGFVIHITNTVLKSEDFGLTG